MACVAAVSAKALQIVLHLKSRNNVENVGPWFYDYLADPNLLNLSGQCTSCHIFDSYEVAQVTLCPMEENFIWPRPNLIQPSQLYFFTFPAKGR